MIKSISLQTFTEVYSLTNEQKYDIDNKTQKHLLLKQFVAWSCNGCTVAPLTNYINNPVYHELPSETEYFSSSDEGIYTDLRSSYGYAKQLEKLERNNSKLNLKIELKNAATKKCRLRIWGCCMGEYLYILVKDGLTLQHKTYSIASLDNDYE